MTRDEIKAVIKHKLDEVSQFDAYQIDSVEFIEEFMDSAAVKVLLTVPLHLIPPNDFSGESQNARSDGSGYIALPSDFLRLTSFQMSEWDRPVVKAISQEHPLYNLQKNNITRGKSSKPVVVIRYLLSEYTSGDGQGFLTPGYYTGAYGWDDIPTNAEITAVVGDAADYTPADNFLVTDTAFTSGLPTTFWVFSNGTTWQVNASVFIPAT